VLRMLNEEADDTLTATQVAKTLNMTVWDFNNTLRDKAYSVAYPHSTPLNVNKKSRGC